MKLFSNLFGERRLKIPDKPTIPYLIEVDDKTRIKFDYMGQKVFHGPLFIIGPDGYASVNDGKSEDLIKYEICAHMFVNLDWREDSQTWRHLGAWDFTDDLSVCMKQSNERLDTRNKKIYLAWKLLQFGIPIAYRDIKPRTYDCGSGITITPESVDWDEFLRRTEYVFSYRFDPSELYELRGKPRQTRGVWINVR